MLIDRLEWCGLLWCSVSHRILWDLWRQVTSHINWLISLHTDELWHFRLVEAARHNEGMGSTGGCLWKCRQLSSTQNEPNETRRARGDFPLVNRLWMVSFSARPGKVYVWETLCDVFISCLDSFRRHPFTASVSQQWMLCQWHISTNLMKKPTVCDNCRHSHRQPPVFPIRSLWRAASTALCHQLPRDERDFSTIFRNVQTLLDDFFRNRYILTTLKKNLAFIILEDVFYFTCNESKIYEIFTFWNNLQEKREKLFHQILIFWGAPVCVCVSVCL